MRSPSLQLRQLPSKNALHPSGLSRSWRSISMTRPLVLTPYSTFSFSNSSNISLFSVIVTRTWSVSEWLNFFVAMIVNRFGSLVLIMAFIKSLMSCYTQTSIHGCEECQSCQEKILYQNSLFWFWSLHSPELRQKRDNHLLPCNPKWSSQEIFWQS